MYLEDQLEVRQAIFDAVNSPIEPTPVVEPIRTIDVQGYEVPVYQEYLNK